MFLRFTMDRQRYVIAGFARCPRPRSGEDAGEEERGGGWGGEAIAIERRRIAILAELARSPLGEIRS